MSTSVLPSQGSTCGRIRSVFGVLVAIRAVPDVFIVAVVAAVVTIPIGKYCQAA